MALRKNALNLQEEYPRAAQVAIGYFYVENGLVGVDSVDYAICLRDELQCFFARGSALHWRSYTCFCRFCGGPNYPVYVKNFFISC